MRHSHGQTLFAHAVHHVREAAGISRRDHLSFRRFDVVQFAVEKLVRHFRLDQIVNARAAATPGAFGKLGQIQVRNGLQNLARLRRDFLSVTKMTRLVIGHVLRGKIFVRGRLDADLREPFVNVFHLFIPKMRTPGVSRIVGQKFRVMFQMRTATRRVRDDGVELFRRKLVDVFSRQSLRHFPFAVVRVKRAAAILLRRRDDFATVSRENFHCVAVHVAEHEVLRATDEHRDTIFFLRVGLRDRRNQIGGKFRLNRRRHCFQFAQTFREEIQNAAFAKERLQAELLIKANRRADELQPAHVHEQPAQRERANETAFGIVEVAALLGFGAGVFEKLGVIHASRTRGHASETTEAKIHFIAERLGRFETFVGDGAHQSDSSARTVAFELGGVVRRAGRQAEAAMHALLHDGVVEVFEVRVARRRF